MPSVKNVFLISVLLVLVVLAILYLNQNEPSEPELSYSIAVLNRGEITATVAATGTLSPLVTVQVGSQVSGNIQHLMADFNRSVKQGDVIAQIEPSLFQAQRAQAAAKLRSAEAALDKARVGQRDAQRQLERAKGLNVRNMVSESELDAAQLTYDQAVVEFKVQQANVAEAKAALQLAEVNLAHTTIVAPIDGIVISRDVDVGQTVAASLQAPTLFTIAQDLSKMQIEADVDEAFIGRVREGQAVTFSVYAYPERKFTGKLVQIRLNPDLEQDVVVYKCIIHVDNSDLSLRPGMTATVSIKTDHRENVLKVHNSALRFVPDIPPEQLNTLRTQFTLARDETLLWTPSSDGLHPIEVNVGLTGDNESEVSGEELKEGMKVAVPGSRKAQRSKRKWGLQLF